MKLTRHKSLIREIAPGVIQIGNNSVSPVLKLNEVTGGVEASSAYLANISGVSLQYENATFDNRPTVSGRDVLLEGDVIDGGGNNLAEIINNTGELLENSIVDVSGILQTLIDQETQDREDADIILNNAIEQISGLLVTEINQLELNILNISGDILSIDGEISSINGDIINISGDITDINNDVININDDIINSNTNILQLQTDLTSISGDITNINGVTYEQAESLAKKWSIIFG